MNSTSQLRLLVGGQLIMRVISQCLHVGGWSLFWNLRIAVVGIHNGSGTDWFVLNVSAVVTLTWTRSVYLVRWIPCFPHLGCWMPYDIPLSLLART